MFLENKLVLLAGSTGLVGSSIVKYITENHPTTKLRAVYHNTKPFIERESVEYVKADLRSREVTRSIVKGCDCAIMAAANTSGADILTSRPWEQINDNLVMNAQLLEAFHLENIRRVVYIGSATLYQEFEGHIREDELDLNKDPHPSYLGVGWVMRFIEKLCRFWHKQCGMEIIIVRASNIFGPYAKFDPRRSNFIPAIIRKAVDKMDPFEVWGSPDITRDVIYSEDFSRAIVMMLDNDNVKFDIVNLGSGQKTTVGDVVEWSLKYARHRPKELTYNSDKPSTIHFRALDCTKAEKVFGWKPEYAIEQGVKETIEWWIENKGWWEK